ncbi:hypothetical protein CFI14_05715 [Lactiplantibacillus pentosus]|nr:hypothetical protein CFK27_08560 [Lactiplantibacillus pentosus]AYG40618.1 hypothetical protein CFI14_05715 [Lactiplantibacillus pentosus]
MPMKIRGTIGLIGVIILVIVGVSFVAYNHSDNQSREDRQAHQTTNRKGKRATQKTIVIYFSETGTTKQAAQKIGQQLGVKTVALKPKQAYSKEYTKMASTAKAQVDRNQHPELAKLNVDLSQYQTIWLGFPTWFHRPPMLINSFFDDVQLKNKTIIPFTTSASSNISESMPYLKKMVKNKQITLHKGLTANDDQAIDKFVKQNK